MREDDLVQKIEDIEGTALMIQCISWDVDAAYAWKGVDVIQMAMVPDGCDYGQ